MTHMWGTRKCGGAAAAVAAARYMSNMYIHAGTIFGSFETCWCALICAAAAAVFPISIKTSSENTIPVYAVVTKHTQWDIR